MHLSDIKKLAAQQRRADSSVLAMTVQLVERVCMQQNHPLRLDASHQATYCATYPLSVAPKKKNVSCNYNNINKEALVICKQATHFTDFLLRFFFFRATVSKRLKDYQKSPNACIHNYKLQQKVWEEGVKN